MSRHIVILGVVPGGHVAAIRAAQPGACVTVAEAQAIRRALTELGLYSEQGAVGRYGTR